MDNLLQQGIAAAKAGEKEKAYQILSRATQDSASAEQAWLWLSSVLEQDSERLFCLDNVLHINPNNEPAKRGSTFLRQKGIFPSAPTPPKARSSELTKPPPAPAAKPVTSPPSHSPSTSQVVPPQAPLAVPAPEVSKEQQDMSALVKFVAVELANNKLPKVIVKELISRGVSAGNAEKIVAETGQLLRKARGEKFKKRMTRGLLWTIAGSVVTCATYVFSDSLGGEFVLCYGAIIIGVIDFLAGLIGWIFSR